MPGVGRALPQKTALKLGEFRRQPGCKNFCFRRLLPSLLDDDATGDRIDIKARAEIARSGVAEAELDQALRPQSTAERVTKAGMFALFKRHHGAAKLLGSGLAIGQPPAGVDQFGHEFVGFDLGKC